MFRGWGGLFPKSHALVTPMSVLLSFMLHKCVKVVQLLAGTRGVVLQSSYMEASYSDLGIRGPGDPLTSEAFGFQNHNTTVCSGLIVLSSQLLECVILIDYPRCFITEKLSTNDLVVKEK